MKLGSDEWSEQDAARFWSKVNKDGPNGCWVWTASKTELGYGEFWWNGKLRKAYRQAWLVVRGEIPEGLVLDHLCRNPSCVNPSHLEAVTHRENCIRGIGNANQRKTHCHRGHEFTPENTAYTTFKKVTSRVCITCRRARDRANYPRKKARRLSQGEG